MAIQKEFVLRYRVDGHIRFQVPARICTVDVAKALIDRILEFDGVYRVNLYRGQQKLSIRYDHYVCDFQSLAKQLFNALVEMESNGDLKPKPDEKSLLWKEKAKAKLDEFKATRWVKEKFGDAKETVQAADRKSVV